MEKDELLRTLKIIVILAIIIGVIGAIFYLIYGFTILWQAMAAGIITGFLLIMVLIFLFLAIYFWLRLLFLKRELKNCQEHLKQKTMKTDAHNDKEGK